MSRSTTTRRTLGAGIAVAVAAAGLVSVQAGTASAAPGAAAKSVPAVGSNVSAQVLSITGTGLMNTNGTLAVGSTTADVATTPRYFPGTAAACATTGGTRVASVSVVSATSAVVTLGAVNATIATGSSLVGKLCLPIIPAASPQAYVTIPYTVAKQPVKASANDFAPAAGPLKGGQTVTAYADATGPLRPDSTLMVNGVLAGAPKVAADGLSMTATTPAVSAAAASQPVVIRTPGFADVTLTGTFAYQNAIIVSPVTAPAATSTVPQTLTVTGAGFTGSAYTGTVGADANTASTASHAKTFHVVLWDGSTGTDCPAQIVSDTTVVCAVPTSLTAAKAYTVIVSDDIDYTTVGTSAHTTTKTVVSSGSTFTVAAY